MNSTLVKRIASVLALAAFLACLSPTVSGAARSRSPKESRYRKGGARPKRSYPRRPAKNTKPKVPKGKGPSPVGYTGVPNSLGIRVEVLPESTRRACAGGLHSTPAIEALHTAKLSLLVTQGATAADATPYSEKDLTFKLDAGANPGRDPVTVPTPAPTPTNAPFPETKSALPDIRAKLKKIETVDGADNETLSAPDPDPNGDETLVVKTATTGALTLFVRTGSYVGTLSLKAFAKDGDKDIQVFQIDIESAQTRSRRRYGIKDFNQGHKADTGWDFNDAVLQQAVPPRYRTLPTPAPTVAPSPVPPNTRATVTFFLKFPTEKKEEQNDLDAKIDAATEHYFLDSGGKRRATLDINNNSKVEDAEYDNSTVRGPDNDPLPNNSKWVPVPKHKVLVRIKEIWIEEYPLTANPDLYARVPTTTPPVAVKRKISPGDQKMCYYAFFTDADGIPLGTDIDGEKVTAEGYYDFTPVPFVEAETDDDGKVVVHIQAGPLIHQVRDIKLDVEERSQQLR